MSKRTKDLSAPRRVAITPSIVRKAERVNFRRAPKGQPRWMNCATTIRCAS